MATPASVQRERDSRIALLEDRYRNELMDERERLELREQIVRLKKKAGVR
jgi:hypothetical protein